MEELKQLADLTGLREEKMKAKEGELRKQASCYVYICMDTYVLFMYFVYVARRWARIHNTLEARALEKEKREGKTKAQKAPEKRNEYLARRFVALKDGTQN